MALIAVGLHEMKWSFALGMDLDMFEKGADHGEGEVSTFFDSSLERASVGNSRRHFRSTRN